MWENACGMKKVGDMYSIVTSGVGLWGPADADRDESGSGDHRLRKIRVDKTGTQNYNTNKIRNRGYQR